MNQTSGHDQEIKAVLAEIAEHLKNDDYKNEEHVRVAVVFRLLQALGWDVWNPRECYPEFAPVKNEDSKRVDVALFKPPSFFTPALFVEVKMVGKLTQKQNLEESEKQLWGYIRHNQADIAVLTDGRLWHFYLPGASGSFDQRHFAEIDLQNDAVSCEQTFRSLLSRNSLESNDAVNEARRLLKRTDEQRIMDEVLPFALQDAELDPTASKVACFIKRCADHKIPVSEAEAKEFILKSKNVNVLPIKPKQPKQKIEPAPSEKLTLSGKLVRFVVHKHGIDSKGVLHADGKRITVLAGAFAAATESDDFRKNSPYFAKLRDEFIAKGVLVQAKLPSGHDVLKLAQDYTFESTSAAASVLSGRTQQGPKVWKEDQQ